MKTCYYDMRTLSLIDLTPPRMDRGWTITRVSVLPRHRGKGIAQELMSQVIADADTEQVNLWLDIYPSGGLTFRELFEWYTRLGFRPINEPPTMMRPPAQKPAWTLLDMQRVLLGG